jgi:hypothetical protein
MRGRPASPRTRTYELMLTLFRGAGADALAGELKRGWTSRSTAAMVVIGSLKIGYTRPVRAPGRRTPPWAARAGAASRSCDAGRCAAPGRRSCMDARPASARRAPWPPLPGRLEASVRSPARSPPADLRGCAMCAACATRRAAGPCADSDGRSNCRRGSGSPILRTCPALFKSLPLFRRQLSRRTSARYTGSVHLR